MDKYYLKEQDNYLTRNANSKYSLTTDIKKACVFNSFEKANNVKCSSLPSMLVDREWEIILVEGAVQDIKGIAQNFEYNQITLEEIKEKVKSTGDFFRNLQGNKDWLNQALSEADKEICDILHFIELYNFSACEGYKLAKHLKDLRVRRREIKNELEVIQIISGSTCNNLAQGAVSTRLANLETKQYTPRVLQNLFADRASKTA